MGLTAVRTSKCAGRPAAGDDNSSIFSATGKNKRSPTGEESRNAAHSSAVSAVLADNGIMVAGKRTLSAFDKVEVLECSAEANVENQPIVGHISMSKEMIDELCEAFNP